MDKPIGANSARISRPQMLNFLEKALAGHRVELAKLQTQLAEIDSLKTQILAEISAQDAQNTAHSQLLLTPQLRIDDLAGAFHDNRLASHILAEKIAMLQKRFAAATVMFSQIDNQIELAEKQINSIHQFAMIDSQRQELEHGADELINVLKKKKHLAARYQKDSEDILQDMNIALDEINWFGAKLASRLENLTKTSLFARSEPFRQVFGDELRAAVVNFFKRLGSLVIPSLWRSQMAAVANVGAGRWAIFLMLMVFIVVLQRRFKWILQRIEKERGESQWQYRRLVILLLRRSLTYLTVTVLLGIFASFEMSNLEIGLRRVLFSIALYLLLMRWALDFLEYGLSGPETTWSAFVRERLTGFFKLLRIVLIVAILLIWVDGFDNLLTNLMRDLLSIVFLIWALIFWHRMKAVVDGGIRIGQSMPSPFWIALGRWWTFIFLGGTFLLHLIGYGNLADLWFTAWIKTAALLFWAYIALKAVAEWRQSYHAVIGARYKEQFFSRSYDIQRPLIQLALLIWFVGLVSGLIWAWDKGGFLYSYLEVIFNFTFAIGSLQLSVNRIVSAVLCLWITKLAVQFWRALLNRYFLEKRTLEQGIKDTILTITGYLAWGLGLIIALGILGVNATSMTVIFGALSVGIGFGLQNIFNNLVSGLILLFERPIQKGDIIEIRDSWAEVKEINVRATLVQTFDNASVIIPNSELISQQVTNWSFKDKRLRRNIEIGVAYGSDIDLVQNTLLEIARDNAQVIKYPQPEVLFIDHADSSLIFRLRIWLYIEDFWAVPSLVRIEIDQRFRQLGIEIAFPQRDLHIRTVPKEIKNPLENIGTINIQQGSESETK